MIDTPDTDTSRDVSDLIILFVCVCVCVCVV